MADVTAVLEYDVDLERGYERRPLPVDFGSGDDLAHMIIVTAHRGKTEVDLAGIEVLAYINRADNATVLLTGTVENGKALIHLTESCYAINGRVWIVVKFSDGDTRSTVLWLEGNINRTSNGAVVDPEELIPSIDELLVQIKVIEDAVERAEAAADRAENAGGTGGTGSGTPGADGFSPIATVTQTDDGAVITITDKTGTTTATIANGAPGPKGDSYTLTDADKTAIAQEAACLLEENDPTVPAWAKASTKPTYTAAEVGALPSTYTPPNQTAAQVGADPAGTAASKVSAHNADEDAHPAIRQLISDLSGRLSALADSDDTTLDQLSEIVAYIKSNKNLIDSITTGKVSVADIVNNLTTNTSTKPLSAAQGVALKKLIDAIVVPTKTSQLTNDSGYLTEHQDISHLLPRTELGAAVDVALAEAKASGAFDGEDGKDGYTPIAGVDYYTPDDKAEFTQYIASEMAKRGQLEPEFANSIDDCTDESKLYVLPDGYIYAYIVTVTEGETVPNYTNLMDDPKAYIKEGYRYSHSGKGFKEQATDCAIVVPVPSGKPVIRVRGAGNAATYNATFCYDDTDNAVFDYSVNANRTVEDNGDIVIALAQDISGGYCVFMVEAGVDEDALIVTANEEITETTTPGGTSYQWASTGHAFVPADYEDRIIAVENAAESNAKRIAALESKPESGGDVVMYISPTGDDANTGLSAGATKKTVKACVEAGATRISAKRGVYAEAINLTDIGSLEIFPTDNNTTYVAGEERPLIVFDTSDSLAVSTLAAYNAIKRVAYSNTNAAYDAVFVKKTLTPTVSASQSSYHAALWLFSDDETTVCRKPKPVLTIAECEAETNTFCYADGYIYVNADLSGVTKLVIPTITDNGFYVNGADKLVLREVEVRFAGEYTYDLRNCAWVDFYKCSSKYTTRASGFHPVNTNGIFRACYATKCFDGFSPNSHGHTTYIDCVSEYNYDDGMSHHAGTEGTVIGGRYEGNGKGGNIPSYGAKVNIYGGLYKDNKQFGVCYAGDSSGNFAQGMVQGAVMVGNPVGLEVQTECLVTALDCHYTGNTKDKNVNGGTLTEY